MPLKVPKKLSRFRRAIRRGGCKFGCEFNRTDDSRLPWNTENLYGGCGGSDHHDTESGTTHIPIVFVHGNQRDSCDWNTHVETYLNRGVGGDSLWAITFADATPSHTEMATQLDHFVKNVREYTGSNHVAIVAHSLGVTGVRLWLNTHNRYAWVDTFVGLGGANHGTDAATLCCRFGLTEGPHRANGFIRGDYDRFDDHPLAKLNTEETPGDIEYYTIRGEYDDLFWMNRDSPVLEGAEENVVLPTGHEGIREDADAVELVYEWAVTPLTPSEPDDS